MNLWHAPVQIAVSLLFAACSAGAATFTHTTSFDLGPGETAVGLAFPQFDIASYPGITSLDEVVVKLEVTFAAGMTLNGSPTSDSDVDWTLGPAQAVVVPITPGVAAPSPITTSLDGTWFVPRNATVAVTPDPSVLLSSTATATAPDLAAYLGTGTVAYELDFVGLYSRAITSPASATGLFSNDRITGQLKITYVASGPTPTFVRLNYLGAQREATGWVAVNWQTGVEYNLLGFHLERQDAGGEWTRLNSELVPAMGSTNQPKWYRFEDLAAPLDPGLNYRLVCVDREGVTAVAGATPLQPGLTAELQVRGGDLDLAVRGSAGALVVVETSEHAVQGSWTSFQELRLDPQGVGFVRVGPALDGVRFYRVRLP